MDVNTEKKLSGENHGVFWAILSSQRMKAILQGIKEKKEIAEEQKKSKQNLTKIGHCLMFDSIWFLRIIILK